MGDPRGFLKHDRVADPHRDAGTRTADFDELATPLEEDHRRQQASRCMDCGVPFCMSEEGCPLGNRVPEFNQLVHDGKIGQAYDLLTTTNNFPEFTGRVCPAMCEGTCSLNIYNGQPTTNRDIERFIVERAWDDGHVRPRPPVERTGKQVAVIGSGPAGLAAADQLNHAGHEVTVFEKADRFGGLLTYGIPNMKLDKSVVDRRVELMRAEGVHFVANAEVGQNVDADALRRQFDAVLLTTGTSRPRDLPAEGRECEGIHFAMDYLTAATKHLLDPESHDLGEVDAEGRRVIVIGGGDTGNDCIATATRHGAAGVVNLELLPEPPAQRAADNPWPQAPRVKKTDYGHKEAAEAFGDDPRRYSTLTKRFVGDDQGRVAAVETVDVEWVPAADGGRPTMRELPGSEKTFDADLVLLGLGFLGPDGRLAEALGVATDGRSNYDTGGRAYATNVPGVFAAGDCRRGQSLVAWAIREGRDVAAAVDGYLTG